VAAHAHERKERGLEGDQAIEIQKAQRRSESAREGAGRLPREEDEAEEVRDRSVTARDARPLYPTPSHWVCIICGVSRLE
jgi:hypothetical protein